MGWQRQKINIELSQPLSKQLVQLCCLGTEVCVMKTMPQKAFPFFSFLSLLLIEGVGGKWQMVDIAARRGPQNVLKIRIIICFQLGGK